MRKCLIQNQAELGEWVTPVLSYFLKNHNRKYYGLLGTAHEPGAMKHFAGIV